MYIDDHLKNKNKKNNIIKVFIAKFFILLIIFLITVIAIKKDDSTKKWLNDNIFSKNFSFTKIKTVYNKYFGSIIPFDIIKEESVFNEKLQYKNINKYKDGISLLVNNNYLVPNLYSGIVVFVGKKDDFGNTIIVESENISVWYSNISSNIKLYDEVKKGEYLGETMGEKLYLVFQKEGEYVDYKEYIN